MNKFTKFLKKEKINFSLSPKNIEELSSCTFNWSKKPLAVIFPDNENQLELIVKSAFQNKINLHPISTGKNWGFGSSCVSRENSVIVDLSSFNQIKDYNKSLGTIKLGPGVTFAKLYKFLKLEGDLHICDPTGAGADTSLVGNYLQKGHGLTNYGDHIENLISIKGMDSKGSRFDTSQYVPDKYGKDITRFDSDFDLKDAIIIEIEIALMPKPQQHTMVVLHSDNVNFFKNIERLSNLKLDRFYSSTLLAANDYRMALSLAPMDKKLDLDISDLKEQFELPDWVVIFSLYENSFQILAAKKELLRFKFKSPNLKFIDAIEECDNDYLRSCFSLSIGHPVSSPKRLFRGKNLKLIDLPKKTFEKENCGFYWLTASIKAEEKDLSFFHTLVSDFMKFREIIPELNIFGKRERVLHAHIGFNFDLSCEDEAKKYQSYYNELSNLLKANKFLPHRVGIQDSL